MKRKTTIQIPSPVGGSVDVTGFLPIIDNDSFQMLDAKRQTGVLFKTFRGANHTRFEHSLGVFQIAGVMCDHLDIDEKEKRATQAYALLHDVGHIAFSHNIEPLLSNNHDITSTTVIRTMRQAIDACGVDNDILDAIVNKEHIGYAIVKHKAFGADRLDYLFRDPYHCGLDERFDTTCVINHIYRQDNNLVGDIRGAGLFDRLIQFYYQMHTQLYYNKQYVAGNRMLQRAVQEMLDQGEMTEQELLGMTDPVLETRIAHSPTVLVRSLGKNIISRGDSYKPVVAFRMQGYQNQEIRANKQTSGFCMTPDHRYKFLEEFGNARALTSLEHEIGEICQANPGEVLISSILDFDRINTLHDLAMVNGEKSTTLFSHIPYLPQLLKQYADAAFFVRVLTPQSNRPKIHKHAPEIAQYLQSKME